MRLKRGGLREQEVEGRGGGGAEQDLGGVLERNVQSGGMRESKKKKVREKGAASVIRSMELSG